MENKTKYDTMSEQYRFNRKIKTIISMPLMCLYIYFFFLFVLSRIYSINRTCNCHNELQITYAFIDIDILKRFL